MLKQTSMNSFIKLVFVLALATIVPHYTSACQNNGGACVCGSGGDGSIITLNRFFGDQTDMQVWGCGGAFALSGATVGADVEATPEELSAGINVGLQFEQQSSFYGWEGCCYVCGKNLETIGSLSPGWYCEKDFFSTGIWLKGNSH